MFTLVKKNTVFFIPYFIFLLAGGGILVLWDRVAIHLFINKYHTPGFDFFFTYWTDVGLGWLIIPVALLLSFVRLRYVIISIMGFLMTFIINDTLKQLIGAPRPAEVFSQLHQSFYTVPGVDIFHWNSFPSGHTAIAFCLFCILAMAATDKGLKFICFLVAFLVAYSRMYLSEHFLADVYAASFIGNLCALVSFDLGTKLKWLNKFSRIDKPLINLRKIPSHE